MPKYYRRPPEIRRRAAGTGPATRMLRAMHLGMLDLLLHGQLTQFVIIAISIVVAIALHEFGHAVADEIQGDPTARLAGRLTINPVRHLDPVGTLMIVLVGFGWGKPVPITPSKLRNRRFGAAFVGAAGPIVNVILALIAGYFVARIDLARSGSLMAQFLFAFLSINVLPAILPPDKQGIIYFLDQYGFVIVLIAALFVLPRILTPLVDRGVNLVLRLVG